MEAGPHEEFGGQDPKLLGAPGECFLFLISILLSGYLLYSSFLVDQPSLLLSPHGDGKVTLPATQAGAGNHHPLSLFPTLTCSQVLR